MNYKKRDDELIKLNKQAREKNKSYNVGNNSSDVGYTNKAFESRRKLPVVTNSPNKATTQANAPVKTSEPKKPSTRYSNQTAGDTTPKQSTRDTRFDNDFDNFYEYRYARSDMMDYDPRTENSIPHWQNLKKEIMAKNKWSENEFDSKWNEYNQERNKKEADKEINTMVELGKKNAILGTIGQAAYMPQTMIEGAGAMLSNLMPTKYKAQSADDGSFTGTRVREATKQAVKDAHIKSGAGKTAYDVGTSLADMVIGSGIPVLGAASLGLETAARTNMEALERGTSANKAAATAGLAGLISGAMNKVGLDKAAGAEAKTALGKVLKGAGVEAAENLLEDTANLGVDTLINTDKSQINALHEYYANQGMDDKEAWNKARLDVLADLATSALSGAAFGGAMNGVRNLPSLIPEIRDLTRGLELNNRGGVDTPEISKELNKAIPAPTKVYSFEPMTGEAKANNEALYKDLGKQLKQKNAELDEAYKAYKSIPKGKKNKYKKTEAYKKVEKLRQEAEDIRWQKRNVRAATQGNVALQLSKEDYNKLFDGQKGITNLINLTVKFAGNTDEAQQLGRDANAALKQYVQSGNADDYFRFTKLAGDLSNIADQVKADYVAKNGTVYKYDDVWGGTVDKEDWYPYENNLKNFVTESTVPNLVKGIHATKSVPEVTTQAGESAPEIPRVVEESAPIEVDPNNVVYHSGILSRLNKADSAGMMESTRGTGYYGTGHYFVDQAHRNEIGEGTNYANKPYSSVDISKYNNLFKADTDAKASKLHSFSQSLMGYMNGSEDRHFTDSEGIVSEDLKDYMDDMYSQYKDLFGDKAMDRDSFENRLNDFRKNYAFDHDDMGDSAFTTFMKEHGYNGVDTRGTASADTRRGVVIYDLDEDSVLQSNVNDEATKNGLMNTRVRNGQPVFDEATDVELQKKIDAFNKKQDIEKEYRRIYDHTKLQGMEDDIEKTEERIKTLKENTIPYYEDEIKNGEDFQDKVNRKFKEFKKYDPEITVEYVEELVRRDDAEAADDLASSRAELEDLEKHLAEVTNAYNEEKELSNQARQQAKNNIEGIGQEQPVNNVPKLTAEEQANNNVPKLSPEEEYQKPKGDWNNPDAKYVRQSFQGKMRYISDSKNEYAKKFLNALKKFEKNPTAENYRNTVNAHNEYTANSGSKRMKNWYGEWYEKTYEPDDISNQLKRLAKRYGIDDTVINSVTPTNVPPTEPPVNNEPPTVDSMIEPPTEGKDIRRESKVGTNTGVNSKLFTENQIKNDPVLSELNKYIPSSEQESFDNALMNVDKNGDELLNDYITGKKTIDNDRDVDQSMILLTNLTNRLNDGDTSVETQRNLLFSRLRQAGTKYGQTINAFKKWNNTAEGTVANGLGLLGDTTEKWKKSNKKAKVLNGRIAEALKRLGYDGSMERQRAELPREKVREGVVNVIKREYGSVEGLFNNDDIEFLTDMAMDKSIPIWRITDEIEHKLNHGEWYEWYENEEPVYPINQKLKNAFDALIPREKTVKEPPTLEELKHQVEATIEKEMASIDNFDDDDITYLANLINEGATKDELAEALNMKMATGRFGISVDTQRRVSDLFEEANQYDPDSKQAYDLRTEAYKLIANEAVSEDASGFEKYDSWRYLAMLGNPKTWVRNKIGNEINNVVTGVSNNISAALEAGVNYGLEKMGKEGIQRTKAFLNPVDDRGLIKAATEDGDNHRYSELLGSKYERGVKDAIKQQKSVFNSKALRTAEAVVDWGISDYKNVKRKYGTSLAGYMKANGLDENAFKADNRYRELLDKSRSQLLTDAENAEMNSLKPIYDELEKARDYAVKQAEYATFHEDNAFAKWWTDSTNRAPAPIRFIREGILPFKKTPANILKSGFQYNPLGAIESIAKTGKLIYENTGKRKGNLEDTYIGKDWKGKDVEINKTLASEVIDSWSKTATGSLLVGLGFYLKNKGILNSSNRDEKYQDQLEGKQNYSITINGHTYTLDWAAPGVMPLLMGAELSKIKDKNLMLNKNWYENMSELVGTVNAILDPMFETSMLSGVKDTMQQAANDLKFDEDAAVGGILGSMGYNAATGYITQGLPTLSGQIARTVDNTRRSTDTVNEGPLGVLERQGRKLMNKIPGLSYLNQPYYDSYARTQNNGPKNPLLNLAYQLGSPGYLQKINTTPADEAARNTYYALSEPNEEGERLPIMNKDVFPSWKSKVTVNDQKYTPEQMATYRVASGEAQYAIRDALAKEDWFNNLSGEKQTDLLKKVNNLVDKIGKDANGDGSDNKELGIYQSDGVPGLLNYWHGTDEYQKWIDDTGIGTGTNAAKEVKALMLEGNFDEANEVAQKAKTDNEARVKYNEENGTNIGLADWQKKYSDTTPTTSTQSTSTPTTTTPKASTTTRPTVTETKQPSPRPHPIGSNATSNNASSTANVDMSDYDKQIARAGKQSRKFENDLPVLVGLGAKEPETYTYAYAINQDPSLTAKTYHDTYTKLNYDGANAVSQQDMINYFNANNLNEQQGMYYWTTYGEKGGQPWKTLPRLTNGTWKK